jgi:NodT family efflux transporter outer membrane factor (OMF) lipoprotein
MSLHFYQRLTSILVAGAFLGGCASTSEQDLVAAAGNSVAHIPEWSDQSSDAHSQTELTQLMNIPQLNTLIAQAMKSNPSLQQTLLALKISYAEKGITASNRIPELSASTAVYNEDEDSDYFKNELSISWEIDLWNRIGNQVNAADKDISADIANLNAAKDALAASIMRSWLQISLQKQKINIEKSHLKLLEDTESLILDKYRSGLGDLEDLDTAKTNSAVTRSTLVEYNEILAQYERGLTLTLGQFNKEVSYDIPAEFSDVMIPLALLPSQSIANRPDVQSALYTLQAEDLRTNAAYKARLPSLSLSLALTDSDSYSFSDALFSNPVWSLLSQLSAPIFDGGKLKNQAEQAELTQQRAYWIYQDTLLTAANEVDNALGLERALAEREQHYHDALESALRSYESYQDKYQQGLVDIYDLISIQENTFAIRSQLAQIQYERLSNRIDLGLALGLGVNK